GAFRRGGPGRAVVSAAGGWVRGSAGGGGSSPTTKSNGPPMEKSQRSTDHSPCTRFGSGPVSRPETETPNRVMLLYLIFISTSKSMTKRTCTSQSASKLSLASTQTLPAFAKQSAIA